MYSSMLNVCLPTAKAEGLILWQQGLLFVQVTWRCHLYITAAGVVGSLGGRQSVDHIAWGLFGEYAK